MITVSILTKNNEKTLKKALDSVKHLDEIIVLDTGSTDNTVKIAEEYGNVKIYKGVLSGFGDARNRLAKLAENDWILVLDSDEELSEKLKKELLELKLNPRCVYSAPFHNYYNNKQIKHCGWHREFHIRLYNKKYAAFDNALVHEGLIIKNVQIKKLKNPINHYSYNSIGDFLTKMQRYSTLFAEQNSLKGKKTSFLKAVFHGIFAFFKTYIIKCGILDGKEGFMISVYNANTAFYKYLKLNELNNASKSSVS